MRDFEKLQALVKAALAQEAEQKKVAKAESEQSFKTALEQALSQQLRDMLELNYTWDQEHERPQATFDLWGPRVVTCAISYDDNYNSWMVAPESGLLLVESASGETFEKELLLAIGHYWDQVTQPASAVHLFS